MNGFCGFEQDLIFIKALKAIPEERVFIQPVVRPKKKLILDPFIHSSISQLHLMLNSDNIQNMSFKN